MTHHRERHLVLAGNIAHLDTPGYGPVDRECRLAGAPAVLAVTHEGRIAASGIRDVVTAFDDGGALQDSGGNAVSLQRELSKIATAAERVSRHLVVLRCRRRRRHLMSTMDGFTAMEVSVSGLSAERTRMDIAASNLANARTTQAVVGRSYRPRGDDLAARRHRCE